jgi:hypothetical protein
MGGIFVMSGIVGDPKRYVKVFVNFTKSLIAILTTCLAVMTCSAQPNALARKRDKPAGSEELAAITARGKAIAAYDVAAWHATDVVQAMHPPPDAVAMYLGRQTAKGWEVVFGKLNESRDAFLLAYDAEPTADVLHPKVTASIVPFPDHGDWLNIARAYDLARSQLRVNRPYNGAVLAASNGNWYAYFYPAQVTQDSFPTGADTRFLISHEGTKILETHPMHLSLLEYTLKDAQKVAMTFHTAVVDDAPEDMDVANVLMMSGTPMIIAGKTYTYKVQPNGEINFLGTTADFLKDAKK